MKLFRNLLALVLSLALLSPLGASAAAGKVYGDVPPEHWAESVIQKAGDYNLMLGFDDGTFGLGKSMTRAELVTILSRMFQWPLTPPPTPTFADCPADTWYHVYVEAAAASGVADRDEPFRPDQPVTRREMADMLVRALGYEQIAAAGWSTPFADVSGEGAGVLAVAYDVGMVTGSESFGKLLFRPEDTATREEAAAMLVRVYERYSSKIDWLHGFYAFSSFSQIGLTAAMDAVSVGWGRLEVGEGGTPFLNTERVNGNDWNRPADYTAATDVFTANSTPMNLNLYGSDTALFLTPEARAATVAAIAAASVDYAGITMDVEALKGDEVKAAYTALMGELRAALPADKTLYVCVQPDTWYTGFDYKALGEICDKVILMAHDYQWTSIPDGYVGTDKTDSPVTPINEIYRALRSITDPETGVSDRSKLALAISFANVSLPVDENNLLSGTKISHPSVATVHTRLLQEDTEMGWSDAYMNPCAYYNTEDGSRYRVWYEDSRSVAAKVRLARMFGVNGVSLWRLGTIPAFPEPELNFNAWETLLAQR